MERVAVSKGIKDKKEELERIHQNKAKLSTRNPQHFRRYAQLKEDSERLHSELAALQKEKDDKVQRVKELRKKIDAIQSSEKNAKSTKRHLKKEYDALQREISELDSESSSKNLPEPASNCDGASKPGQAVAEIERPNSYKDGPGKSNQDEEDDEETYNQSPDQFGLHEQNVFANQTERHLTRRKEVEKDVEEYESAVSKKLDELNKDLTESLKRERRRTVHTYEISIKALHSKSSRKVESLSQKLVALERLSSAVNQRKQTNAASFSNLRISTRTLLNDAVGMGVSCIRDALFFTATIRDFFFCARQQPRL